MQKPYIPPENKMMCPECGSTKVKVDEEFDVKSTTNGPLKQYVCEDCKSVFIPALVTKENPLNTINENIKNWSKSVRIAGNNDEKSWVDNKPEFIIIKRKSK